MTEESHTRASEVNATEQFISDSKIAVKKSTNDVSPRFQVRRVTEAKQIMKNLKKGQKEKDNL